jgi:hypothetical protein
MTEPTLTCPECGSDRVDRAAAAGREALIEALCKDSDFFQDQAHRMRDALRRITEADPGTTAYDMRRIATEALTPNAEVTGA